MKCTNCGHDLPDNAKFCEMCGAPVLPESTAPEEQTQLADDDYRDDFRDDFQGDYREGFRDDFNSYNAFDDDPYAGNDPYAGGYPNDGYPDRRFDGRDTENRMDYNGGPVYDDRYGNYGNNRSQKPRMSTQKKALIISAISLVLVVAILGGVIFFVSRNKVSAAELEEAKENFLPPAEAVSIDTSLEDPSNDKIQFKYDGRARISSCSYAVNDKTYDQSYSYNENDKLIKIDTKYRNRLIFTKEIGYDRVSEANTFEAIDGYYVRMDEKSLGIEISSSSQVPVETAAPEPPNPKKEPTEPKKPTEKPTEKPEATTKPKETTKPSSQTLKDYQRLYIDFLDNTSISYDYGTLIYLDSNDTPELILWSSGSEVPYYVCFIKNNKVQSFETAASHSLEYNERGGFFTTGTYDQSGYVYYFDGSSVSKEHTYSFSYGNDEFFIDQEQLSEEDYFDAFDSYYLVTDRKHDASNDPHDKSALEDYIRNY